MSEAAGARFVKVPGKLVPAKIPDIRGAASISVLPDDSLWYCCRLTWPNFLLLHSTDQLGLAYGCKSTFLELVDLMQPLLTIPIRLQGRELLFLMDNIAMVNG